MQKCESQHDSRHCSDCDGCLRDGPHRKKLPHLSATCLVGARIVKVFGALPACIACIAHCVRAVLSVLLLSALQVSAARAQSPAPGQSPIIVTPPIVDAVDENHVSIFSGKAQFSIPALQLGDVSFVPFSVNGQHFAKDGVMDRNYGYI